MAGALRDAASAADLAAPVSREAAPWLLVVLAFAASVWSGDLVGAVLHGAGRHGAVAGLDGGLAGAADGDGDGDGLLRLASPLVSSLLMPRTGAIRMRAMTSVWSGTASLG
jgi:hypothetical protein